MTGRLLDVSSMPFDQVYTCQDGSEINLGEFLDSHYDAIQALAAAGLIKANESFGFAMLRPTLVEDYIATNSWDKPEEFVWFVGGWGPDRDRYIANAIRKLRPLFRLTLSALEGDQLFTTLDIRFWRPSYFEDVVEQMNDDGTFPWGDFPWGGAVSESFGEMWLIGAVSCLTEIEDDFIAKLILGGLGKLIVTGNKLLVD